MRPQPGCLLILPGQGLVPVDIMHKPTAHKMGKPRTLLVTNLESMRTLQHPEGSAVTGGSNAGVGSAPHKHQNQLLPLGGF